MCNLLIAGGASRRLPPALLAAAFPGSGPNGALFRQWPARLERGSRSLECRAGSAVPATLAGALPKRAAAPHQAIGVYRRAALRAKPLPASVCCSGCCSGVACIQRLGIASERQHSQTPAAAPPAAAATRPLVIPSVLDATHLLSLHIFLAGAAGCAYALWHAHRNAAALESVASEADLLGSAELYARAALQGVAGQPPERYGWALLAGHAGVYCAGALVLSASAALARRQGREAAAAQLQGEAAEAVRHFCALQRLACSTACEEDEVCVGGGG